MTATQVPIQVALRVRPLFSSEHRARGSSIVTVSPNSGEVLVGDRLFQFDHVFGPDSQQEDLFEVGGKKLADKFLEGYNATILAYGQTSSGKSYSMGCDSSSLPLSAPSLNEPLELLPSSVGLIPRVLYYVFNHIQKDVESLQKVLRVSYLEIYREQIYDLLQPDSDPHDVSIRESSGRIIVTGMSEHLVQTYDEAISYDNVLIISNVTGTWNEERKRERLVVQACMKSQVGPMLFSSYNWNKKFKTRPEKSNIDQANCVLLIWQVHGSFEQMKTYLGSERLKRTNNSVGGDRFKESIKINSGLLALGNVIRALTEKKLPPSAPSSRPQTNHVPYRESKLTRLLQDSLGGSSFTFFFACISPAKVDFEETIHTLGYATRVRSIKNSPKVNKEAQLLKMLDLRRRMSSATLSRPQTQAGQNANLNNAENEAEMDVNKELPDVPTLNEEYHVDPEDADLFQAADQDKDWIVKYMDRLRERTVRASNASKALTDLQEEQTKLHSELSDTKNELYEARKTIESQNQTISEEREKSAAILDDITVFLRATIDMFRGKRDGLQVFLEEQQKMVDSQAQSILNPSSADMFHQTLSEIRNLALNQTTSKETPDLKPFENDNEPVVRAIESVTGYNQDVVDEVHATNAVSLVKPNFDFENEQDEEEEEEEEVPDEDPVSDTATNPDDPESIARLRRRYRDLRKEFSNLQRVHLEQDAELEKTKSEFEMYSKDVDKIVAALKEDLENARNESSETENKVGDLMREVDKLSHELSAIKKKTREDAQKYSIQETKLMNEMVGYQKQIAKDEKRIQTLQRKLESLQKTTKKVTEEESNHYLASTSQLVSSSLMQALENSRSKSCDHSATQLVLNKAKEIEDAPSTSHVSIVLRDLTQALLAPLPKAPMHASMSSLPIQKSSSLCLLPEISKSSPNITRALSHSDVPSNMTNSVSEVDHYKSLCKSLKQKLRESMGMYRDHCAVVERIKKRLEDLERVNKDLVKILKQVQEKCDSDSFDAVREVVQKVDVNLFRK